MSTNATTAIARRIALSVEGLLRTHADNIEAGADAVAQATGAAPLARATITVSWSLGSRRHVTVKLAHATRTTDEQEFDVDPLQSKLPGFEQPEDAA